MSASSDPELLRRLLDFELTLEADSSEIVEEFEWGRLIHNPEISAMWSSNYLEIHSGDLDAVALAELAGKVQAPLGIEHRDVVPVDPRRGEELVQGFQALDGWEVWRSVYMVRARDPDREAGAAIEVPRSTVAAVRRAVAEHDPDFTQEAVEQRFVRDARLDRVGNGRWFAAPADGPPGASCVLYQRNGIGQVETVGTTPDRRGHGLASAVVMAAVQGSREAGNDLTFIVADADDWPWRLYERLGFDRVGEVCTFLRKPPQLRGDSSP
ncbi:MAG TPA: GNAT family N-acetyltransferase [Solirubrobacterales bacterium]|nr:GNAT family N-acetyltransferase [Solirubrobacterales bacterium]